jgi:HEAT repeat protein
MAPEAGPILLKNLDHKNLDGKQKAHRAVILSLGRTQEPKGVKALFGLLDDFDAYVRAAALQSLGSYTEADEKVRKAIVEEVLKAMVPLADSLVEMQADSGERQEVERYFNAMRAPARRTLELLTGNEEADFFDWRAWWNDNKHERWEN